MTLDEIMSDPTDDIRISILRAEIDRLRRALWSIANADITLNEARDIALDAMGAYAEQAYGPSPLKKLREQRNRAYRAVDYLQWKSKDILHASMLDPTRLTREQLETALKILRDGLEVMIHSVATDMTQLWKEIESEGLIK